MHKSVSQYRDGFKAHIARSVDAVDRMPGGASLAMHRLTVTFADGHTARLVLRRYAAPTKSRTTPMSPPMKQPCWTSSNGSRHRHLD